MFTNNADPQKQIAEVRAAVQQVYADIQALSTASDVFAGVLNGNVTMQQLLNLLSQTSRKAHTSTMPDSQGSNADHDGRYYTKAQIDARFAAL